MVKTGSHSLAFKISNRQIQDLTRHHISGSDLAALRAAMELVIQESPSERFIFSDSKTVLPCVRSLRRGNYRRLMSHINEICQRAANQGHDIVSKWLPCHCGISGNHLADDAARCDQDRVPTLLM